MVNELLAEKITNLADSIGIDALGFAEASEFTDYALSESQRRDPRLSLADAKSIVVAGIYIGGLTLPTGRLFDTCRSHGIGWIPLWCYAQGRRL